MATKEPTIEFEGNTNRRATITYKTDQGRVKITFYQDWTHSDGYMSDSESCYLRARVESKPRFGFKYKEIAKAYKEVYYSFSDGYHNDAGSRGSTDFFKNMEEVKLTHNNPEIEKLIAHAQKDVVREIPEERRRIAHEKALEKAREEKEKQLEQERKNEQTKKENDFVASFFKFVGKNR